MSDTDAPSVHGRSNPSSCDARKFSMLCHEEHPVPHVDAVIVHFACLQVAVDVPVHVGVGTEYPLTPIARPRDDATRFIPTGVASDEYGYLISSSLLRFAEVLRGTGTSHQGRSRFHQWNSPPGSVKKCSDPSWPVSSENGVTLYRAARIPRCLYSSMCEFVLCTGRFTRASPLIWVDVVVLEDVVVDEVAESPAYGGL